MDTIAIEPKGGMEMLHVKSDTFQKEEMESKVPVLVDFFATWCMPCRMMSQILEEVDRELDGKGKIVKVDVDQNENLARKFGVMSIPTLVLFKDGKMVSKNVGVMQKNDCLNLFK